MMPEPRVGPGCCYPLSPAYPHLPSPDLGVSPAFTNHSPARSTTYQPFLVMHGISELFITYPPKDTLCVHDTHLFLYREMTYIMKHTSKK